jgi:O-glycosyl hydrolase
VCARKSLGTRLPRDLAHKLVLEPESGISSLMVHYSAMLHLQKALTLLLACSMALIAPGTEAASSAGGVWEETRFNTGCQPGPFEPPPPPEHLQTSFPPLGAAPAVASLRVSLDTPVEEHARPILGAGFNLEHALWSCPAFRRLFRSEILDPFMPAIARVDTGLLPAAPPQLPASQLGPAVYESVLSSAPYADSWRFFHRLNSAGVKIVLGVWGGPAQFTNDGTRRGALLPSHYDDYVEYVASVVDFLVRRQNIDVWATTIANEPDGGDGNQIPPDGLAYIAHELAPRLAADGVKVYGPDTADALNALRYLPPLLDDPTVADNLAFVGFHEYYASADVASVVNLVESRRPGLPVVVTEYTSFSFGDLDAGQEANAQNGFMLDIASMLLSHYRNGVDAALYWDTVDYLQPGHDAITRWGLLRGPTDEFTRRQRYYGLQQILPYLQPGAWVLNQSQQGGDALQTLAVRTVDGAPAVFLVNQAFDPVDLTLTFAGPDVNRYPALVVTRTDRSRHAERLGRLSLSDGSGELVLPPRSITTLFPEGAGPEVEAFGTHPPL